MITPFQHDKISVDGGRECHSINYKNIPYFREKVNARSVWQRNSPSITSRHPGQHVADRSPTGTKETNLRLNCKITVYRTFINSSFPLATATCAVLPGSTSLLMPYWYSQVISPPSNGYFAPVIVMPLAQPVMFSSEKKEY